MSKKMLNQHMKVLMALDAITEPNGAYCACFRSLIEELGNGAERREVRRITRHLARRGYAEYHRALMTDEGNFAGAGYCISKAGRAVLEGGTR